MPLQERVDATDPDLVIARREIISRRNVLPRMPALIDRPGAERAAGERDPQRPLFPFGVEIGFVLFWRDRPEAHLPAEIVRAVHVGTLVPAAAGPINRSRLTKSGSAFLVMPSVPSGPSGMTR